MRKGQAFDTFKLMIAAVVAVAILGILMGILSQITLPAGNPENVFQSMMSGCVQSPGSIKTSDVVNFRGRSGDVISFATALQSAGVGTLDETFGDDGLDCTAFTNLVDCNTGIVSDGSATDPKIGFKTDANFQARFKVDCHAGTPQVTLATP